MAKTLEDVKQVHEIASRLEELGVPRRTTDKIRRWVNGEAKRLRDEARDNTVSKLTWKCHICGEERPDDKISVLSKPLVINGEARGQQNIRYCNDRPACVEGAKTFSFFKEGGNGAREG